jgi:hypothetical protein
VFYLSCKLPRASINSVFKIGEDDMLNLDIVQGVLSIISPVGLMLSDNSDATEVK